MLVSDLINQSFVDLAVIQPGETIATAYQTAAFARLNQLLALLSAEQLTVFTETIGSFTLGIGTTGYTMGTAGSWVTATRAQKIVAWKTTSGVYTAGGAPLGFADFDEQAKQIYIKYTETAAQVAQMEAELAAKVAALFGPFNIAPVFTFPSTTLAGAALPMILGADSAYPSLNVRVFPAPTIAATVEVTYWTPITAFSAVSDAIALPPGYEDMLHWGLAVDLYPQYARPGQSIEVIASNYQNAKASIVQQNTPQGAAK